jgi:hypothetical protein
VVTPHLAGAAFENFCDCGGSLGRERQSRAGRQAASCRRLSRHQPFYSLTRVKPNNFCKGQKLNNIDLALKLFE